MLAGLNSLLGFLGWQDCRVRNVRVQRRIYCAEERELTKAEYLRLLEAARRDRRLYLLLETICGTGIRVSELAYFTVEAVAQGEIAVRCKNKTRSILIPGRLRKSLLAYARQSGIASGPVFRTPERKGDGPQRRLGADEGAVCARPRQKNEGFSTQPAQAVCAHVLTRSKRILPNWPTSSGTAASTPRASIS